MHYNFEEENEEENLMEEDLQAEELEERARFRKQLTAHRLVHSIETAQEMDNYDPLVLDENVKTYISLVKDKDTKTEYNMTFTNQQPTVTGRQRQCDVIREAFGVRGIAKDCRTEIDCWQLFITNEMVEMIVMYTNKNIQLLLEKLDNPNESGKYLFLKETDCQEMRELLALFYYRGLYNVTGHSTCTLFSNTKGLPLFSAVMSCERFRFLTAHLGFHDVEKRAERWQSDRYAAFREFLELFNACCTKYLKPGQFLSIDETLYPMRHQIAFRQYNSDKPAK